MSLSYLLQKLKHASPLYQVELVKAYRSNDWKSIVRYKSLYYSDPHQIELWKSNTSRLVLIGWNAGQSYQVFSNYSVIHSNILDGNLHTKGKALVPFSYHYTKPHSLLDIHSFQESASLHLFQTSYLY